MRKDVLTQTILLTLGAALLTACGGGGSSSDSVSNPPPSTNPPSSGTAPSSNVVLTEQIAQPIAQVAFDSGMTVANSSLLRVASTGQAGPSSITLKDIALDAVNRMRTHASSGTSHRVTAQATTFSETENCPHGGTMSYIWVDQDGNEETSQVGDTIKYTFKACKMSPSVEYDGTQSMKMTRLIEDTDTRFKADVELVNDLSITSGADKASLKGTLLLSMDETYTCKQQDCDLTSGLFGLKSDKIELTSDSKRVTIYALDYAIYNNNSGAWWFTQDNILDFNGQVIRIDTTARFDAQDGCSYPHQGSAMIYGKNSSVKVIARPGNVTDLEIDKDGNGTIDATKQVGSNEVFGSSCGY